MTPRADAPSRTRDISLDVAKGVGIILVVIGHAWRGLEGAGMLANAWLFRLVDQVIYNFHMPLFFLLSGITFQDWALRRPVGEAARSRVTRLLWPLALWTYLFTAARLAAGMRPTPRFRGWRACSSSPCPRATISGSSGRSSCSTSWSWR